MDDLPPEALQRADEQLEEWSKPQIEMLWAVTRWYNGVRFDREDESYQIGRACGYPPAAIEEHLTRSFPEIAATERLGQLYAAGAVSREDIDAYQFTDYDPCPTEAGIYQRIHDGRELQNAVTAFDTEHETSIHEHVTAGTTFEHLHII